jgi:hypothetical protein
MLMNALRSSAFWLHMIFYYEIKMDQKRPCSRLCPLASDMEDKSFTNRSLITRLQIICQRTQNQETQILDILILNKITISCCARRFKRLITVSFAGSSPSALLRTLWTPCSHIRSRKIFSMLPNLIIKQLLLVPWTNNFW